jgi:hypothetical protein
MNMADLQGIFETVDGLSPEEVKQLYTYILEHRIQFVGENESVPTQAKPRILGLHAHLGKAWMSEDFNDELPDEFWLGEE